MKIVEIASSVAVGSLIGGLLAYSTDITFLQFVGVSASTACGYFVYLFVRYGWRLSRP